MYYETFHPGGMLFKTTNSMNEKKSWIELRRLTLCFEGFHNREINQCLQEMFCLSCTNKGLRNNLLSEERKWNGQLLPQLLP